MLNLQESSMLGYEIQADPDQPGMYCWQSGEAATGAFTSPALAIIDATEHIVAHQEVYRCELCEKVHLSEHGIAVTRCPTCNSSCVGPVAFPDWDEVLEAFGLDPSFVWSGEQQIEYSRAYLGWSNTVTV